MLRPDLVIAHANCPDGHAAAWVVSRAWGLDRQPEIVFATYGSAPPDVRGRHVLVVDFSYPRAVLERMRADAASLVVLDHHETAMRDLDGFPGAVFDMGQSGAGLAWRAAFPDGPEPPWVVAYTEDADLWRFQLPRSREVRAGMRAYPRTFEAWDRLVDRAWSEVADEGAAILRAEKQHVASMCDASFMLDVADQRVPAAWAPILYSDVREELLARHPEASFSASLRSIGGEHVEVGLGARKGGPHAGELAKQLGGGGHQGAAGFRTTLERLTGMVR